MKKEPIRHHYVPQFILRNFCDNQGLLHYYEKNTGILMYKQPRDVFMEKNLYRDELNHPKNPTKIEADLARYEGEIAKIIDNKFGASDRIVLTVEEESKLKLFFAIMGFRSANTKDLFGDNLLDESKLYYSKYQKDGNFADFWKRNLGHLVNCRSIEDVCNHSEIDMPIKIFMLRDTQGYIGKYFAVLEAHEKNDFVIGDTYPACVFGEISKDIKIISYCICPISPKRCILLVNQGADGTPPGVLGYRPCLIYRPARHDNDRTVEIKVKRAYPEEVENINRDIIGAAQNGYVKGIVK